MLIVESAEIRTIDLLLVLLSLSAFHILYLTIFHLHPLFLFQPVLRVLSASPVSKDTANNLIYQISRSISNPLICVLFLKLIAIGRGFPLYSAIVHTVKHYDPESTYCMFMF